MGIAHSCGIAFDLIAEKQRRMFLLSDIPDSGTGLTAARSISLGEVVIEEEPLVVVEAEVKNSNISWIEKCSYLEKKILNLPAEKIQQYLSLHDCKQMKGEQKSLSGIFRTNNFALGSCALTADHGVFHLCSRLNHSCVSNCEVVWHPNTQTQTVVATKPIEMGSEMTICYLNQGDRFSTTKKRREILGKYGFTCMCSACKNEENNEDVFADAYHKLVEDLQATVSIAIKLENYLKMDKVLEQHGSKLIWRIRNLQNAFNLQNENGDRNGSQQISEKLIYLKSILGINCLL